VTWCATLLACRFKEGAMKGERSTVSPAQKIVRNLTTVEKDARAHEAIDERRKLREEMARKRQER
jgi:hypothetical protein